MSFEFRAGRRRFLGIITFALAPEAFGRPHRGMQYGDDSTLVTALARRIAESLSNPDNACAVGRTYLQTHPQEAHVGHLVNAIVGNISRSDAHRLLTDSEALRNLLRDRHLQDFDQGELATIDGWFFTRSELRRCALTVVATT